MSNHKTKNMKIFTRFAFLICIVGHTANEFIIIVHVFCDERAGFVAVQRTLVAILKNRLQNMLTSCKIDFSNHLRESVEVECVAAVAILLLVTCILRPGKKIIHALIFTFF